MEVSINDKYILNKKMDISSILSFLESNKHKISKIFINHICNHSFEFLDQLFLLDKEITTITHDFLFICLHAQPFYNEIQTNCIDSNCVCKKEETVFVYNAKANDLIVQLSTKESYLITDIGRNKEEYSAIYVQKGKFVGMGYVPKEIDKNDIDEVILYLKKYKENFFIMNQIVAFAMENQEKVLLFE
jgi:hypothetical protein